MIEISFPSLFQKYFEIVSNGQEALDLYYVRNSEFDLILIISALVGKESKILYK